MNVDILCDGKFISATVTVDNDSNYKFAFYLYCNGERIETIWYQNKSSVRFVSKLVPRSRYVVRAFVKKDGEIISMNSHPFLHDFSRYYLEQWSDRCKIFTRDLKNINNSFDELLTKENKIYHFVDEKSDRHLDILFQDMERVYERKAILVCLQGAVSRSKAIPPFFSGLGIAEKLQLPLVSIADPSLTLSCDLQLAWYVGNYVFHDLPYILADFLNNLQDYFKCKIILFGGSGGGFASLLLYKLMKNPNAACAVWNPQIDIKQYFSYKKYINDCFCNISGDIGKKSYSEALKLFDLKKLYTYDHDLMGRIFYYQVFHDNHYRRHCIPFLNTLGISKIPGNTYGDDNFALFIDRKSMGHVAPAKYIISYILDSLYNNVDLSCILANVDANVNGVGDIDYEIMQRYIDLFQRPPDVVKN